MATYESTLRIYPSYITYVNEIMSGDREDHTKDGETIMSFTGRFADGHEADLKVVACGDDLPYLDAVLFDDGGHEVAVMEPGFDAIAEQYTWAVGDDTYVLKIEPEALG